MKLLKQLTGYHTRLLSVSDYRGAAKRILPRMLYDFVDGGALSEQTLARNYGAFEDYRLRPRAFSSSSAPCMRRQLFGADIKFPVMIAPTGASGLLWPLGEQAAARAAHTCGTLMQVSAGSILSMEDIAAASPGPKWLQLFIYRDRGLMQEFIQRAKAAGYAALMVTTDAPVHGLRERDIRNNFTIDQSLKLSNFLDLVCHWRWGLRMLSQPAFAMANFQGHVKGGMADMASYIASVLNPDASWEDLSWLREQWDGPLVVKGVSHPDDARMAVQRGADAIQVSNHGGRQLDGGVAPLDALRDVCDAVAAQVPVLLDGGITRGTDVLKAVALGATACAIGRSHLWGLATAGEQGVAAILQILGNEMRNSMTIGGWKSLRDLDPASLQRMAGQSWSG